MDTLKGKQIMVWTFMGNTSMYQALRENTGGVQDKFLSELVRIMEKYPWCDGVDIDLEKGDDYSTAAKSTAMFRNIYNTGKSYNPAKLMNICLPDMDSINGSVGGENWCVYGVGKYISIERQIEKTKDKYYDVLETSDIGWHEEKNDPTPFIRYMLTVILACYIRFEERVGIVAGNGGSTSSAYDIVKNIQKKKLGNLQVQKLLHIVQA